MHSIKAAANPTEPFMQATGPGDRVAFMTCPPSSETAHIRERQTMIDLSSMQAPDPANPDPAIRTDQHPPRKFDPLGHHVLQCDGRYSEGWTSTLRTLTI